MENLTINNGIFKVAISGGFDPVHPGHIRYIEEAASIAEENNGELWVILNTDEWLINKKGYAFMSWDDRAYIVSRIKGVSGVIQAVDKDGTVRETLALLRPNVFAKGGDRNSDNTPEKQVCEDLGIKTVWGVGGEKIRSSSDLVERVINEF